jgi:CheY-like chemotaxis protein
MITTEVSSCNQIPLILVTDDDRATRTLLKVAMEEEGYQVITAKDGQECLSEYHRSHPDMVLLDAVMPEMDGFTCCQRLHQLPGTNFIPVLMITALDDQDSIDHAFAAGAVDYITKPIHWAVLSQRVKRLLTTSKALLELEHLQSQLYQQRQWLQFFGKLTQELIISNSNYPESLLREMLEEIRQLMQADLVILTCPDGKLRLADTTPGFSLSESHLNAIFNLNQVSKPPEQKEILTINNLATVELPQLALAPLLALQTQSILLAPLFASDRVYGSLSVHHCQTSHRWQSWEVEQFSSLVNLLVKILEKKTKI